MNGSVRPGSVRPGVQQGATSGDDGVSRRRLLRLGLLAAGAGAVAIPAGTLGGYSRAAAQGLGHTTAPAEILGVIDPSDELGRLASAPWPVGPAAHTVDLHPAGTAPAGHPSSRTTAPPPNPGSPAHGVPARPTWLSTWNKPVYQLDEFAARAKGTHFARNAIMLTIDDGPHPEWTPKYLRLLEKYQVHATFCMIGQQVHANRTLVKNLASEGHHIGNHTFHHPLSLPKLSPAKIKSEIEDTTDAIVSASGFRPRQFRAPGGNWGPSVFAEVANQEMLPLGWDVDPRDWSRPGVAHITAAMLAARPHDIILCHDGGGDRSQTFAALSSVIPALLSRGYTFVTLPAPQSI